MPNEPQNLLAAKEYARLGWRVFPLVPKSKAPLTPQGFHEATLDQRQIEEWWLMTPGAGIGIATGSVSKLVVVDIDPRNGGHEALAYLEAKYGALPDTVESQTGGGGRHLFYKLPGTTVFPGAKGLWSGIDIKADGGYVCAPFTVHPSGLKYHWREDHDPNAELAELPGWVLEALKARKASLVKEVAQTPGDTSERIIPEGQRDNALTSLAGTMQRRGMSYEAILRAILAENAARCRPPLPETDVLRIVRSVGRYASDPEADVSVPRGTLERSLAFLDVASVVKPEPISWLLHERLAFGDVSLIVGPPASGKSWMTYEIAVAGAMGLPILGEYDPGKRLKVLLIDEENPPEEVMRRLWLLTSAWGVQPRELSGTLLVSRPCQGWSFRDRANVYALQSQVEQFQPDVVIFDSLVAVSTVKDEADAPAVRQFFHDQAYPIRAVCNSTLLFVHHTNKGVYQFERQSSSAGLVRGSIDFVAAVDSLLMVETHRVNNRRYHSVESVKVRRGEAPETLSFELTVGPNGEGLRPLLSEVTVQRDKGGRPIDPTALGNRVRATILDVLQRQDGEPCPIEKLRRWIEAAVPEISEHNRRQILSRMVAERLISFRYAGPGRTKTMYYLGPFAGGESETEN